MNIFSFFRVSALIGVLAWCHAAAVGQEDQSNAVYLTAARLIDPVSQRVVENPAIVISDGMITARGRAGALAAPAGARRIDLKGMTLLPGFIDMHAHLIGSATKGRGYDGYAYPRDRELIWGVANAKDTLMAGFTTVRNVGAGHFSDIALRDAINEGEVPGPRLFVSGPPVGILGGHCSDDNRMPSDMEIRGENVATGPWEMREKVRRNIKFGVDLIKTCSTGGVFSKGTLLGAPQSTVEELKAIVDEAHMRGLKVASHAHGTQGIKNAIEAGVDTIEHASFLDDEAISMAKRNGTYLAMDIYNTEFTLARGAELGVPEESLNKEREVGTIQRESFTRAVKAGVKVIYATDSGVYPHADVANQFSRMVRFGMSEMQAVVSATALAAEALGKTGTLGCLDPGCHADIVAVAEDPMTDISALENVAFVMKGGTIFKHVQK